MVKATDSNLAWASPISVSFGSAGSNPAGVERQSSFFFLLSVGLLSFDVLIVSAAAVGSTAGVGVINHLSSRYEYRGHKNTHRRQ